jgi:hypothetical protein
MEKPTIDPAIGNLLDRVKEAFAAVNEAEAAVNEAVKAEREELVSRSNALGVLLLEAKKDHPTVDDFKAFLKGVDGLKISRAYDYMRVAGGRTTVEELREEASKRKRKSRAKKKSDPTLISVTVTESRAENGKSARALAEFIEACKAYLPGITDEAHRERARLFVTELTTPKAEAA